MKIPSAQIESHINKIHQEKIAGCLVFGPEQTLVNYRVNLIAKKICPNINDPFLVANIDKDKISENPSIISDEFFSYSMLGGRKLIIIKNSDSSVANSLKSLFEDKNYAKKSDNFILIQGGDLDKSSSLRKICEENVFFSAIACYEDNEFTIKKFITDELSKNKISYDSEAINYFFSKIGKNRPAILSEIEKLSLYLGSEKKISAANLEATIGHEISSSVDDLMQNMSLGKTEQSLKILEKLTKDSAEKVATIRAISRFFFKLHLCKEDVLHSGISEDEALKRQKIFFKSEQTFKAFFKKLSEAFLKKILLQTQEIEEKIKTQNNSGSLDLLILIKEICEQKKS